MAEVATECFCPHSVKQQAEGAKFERADCCEVQASFAASAPAVSETSRLASLFAAPAVPHSLVSALPASENLTQSALQLWGVPWPNGPPLFLKIRTLLI